MNVFTNRSIVLLVGYGRSPARDLLQSRQSISYLCIYTIHLLQAREKKKKSAFQPGGRDNNRVQVWCLSEGQLWWWDWLVAGWWGGHLARPQEDALAQCGCSSSHNQNLPHATDARREDKRSTLPTKGHVATLSVFCSFFASRVCECHGLLFFKNHWILLHSLRYIPFSKTKPEQNMRSD